MYIQYKTEVVGIIDSQPKQIKINYNDIRSIKFYFQEDLKIGNYLFITFKFSGKELTLESAQAITKPYLNSLIDLLIFKFNVPVSEPTIHAYKTIENHMVASCLWQRKSTEFFNEKIIASHPLNLYCFSVEAKHGGWKDADND